MTRDDEAPDAATGTSLTAFQVDVARTFFDLPASAGFLLAGGAALAAQHLTARPTRDLDFFTQPGGGSVVAARDAFEQAARQRGWAVRRIQDSPTFCRIVVEGGESVVVDLAVDVAPGRPPTASVAGPTFDLEELAGRKVLALFDRAEARDFADVYALAQRYDLELLLTRAAAVDAGFDRMIFAGMLRTIDRFSDEELSTSPADAAALRAFFADWSASLTGTA